MDSPIKMKNMRAMSNLYKLFPLAVLLQLPNKLVKFLIKLTLSKFYNLIFGLGYLIGMIRIHNLRFINALQLALFNFSKYLLKP